ncbi:hypothetical protein M8J76_001034 [Diaphorina citri]|nr:hypothetical protein M8J76_001034 [Diaphorina citri]
MMRSSDQTIYKSVPNTTRYGLRESRYEIKEKRQRRGLSSSLALVRAAAGVGPAGEGNFLQNIQNLSILKKKAVPAGSHPSGGFQSVYGAGGGGSPPPSPLQGSPGVQQRES